VRGRVPPSLRTLRLQRSLQYRAIPKALLLFCIGLQLVACSTGGPATATGAIRLSIIGTNDVHGQLLPDENSGGLLTLSGYVDALRNSSESDAVLLVDAGDMWQGTLESNLGEGQPLVAAYNALGYAAATIGNHEFDFGPVGEAAIPDVDNPNPRGALRARASEANFPLLAANLVIAGSGDAVDWDNVRPATRINVAGIEVGIIGVMTSRALRATIAANVTGLSVTPLANSIQREALKMRAANVDLVLVLAHAGGRCREFDDPNDLSSCDLSGEIFQVAEALPRGLVDHIVAGHVHDGIAHIVNGISITSSYSSGRAFGRVDFFFDRQGHALLNRQVFAPQTLCASVAANGGCIFRQQQQDGAVRAQYAGLPVVPNEQVAAIAEQAHARAEAQAAALSGAWLAAPLTLTGNPESALGNLFTDALLAEIDADVAIHNVSGGIRAVLPAGDLTFGDIYRMFPFDNRVLVLELPGSDLRKIVAEQAKRGRRRVGFSGMRVAVSCDSDRLTVEMTLADGRTVGDSDPIRLIANDYLAFGGDDILNPAMPEEGFALDGLGPLTRDVLYDWFRKQERLYPEMFDSSGRPRWTLPAEVPATCRLATDDLTD
jgi:5'-nucleotidase